VGFQFYNPYSEKVFLVAGYIHHTLKASAEGLAAGFSIAQLPVAGGRVSCKPTAWCSS
jgi:hypothetical protein